MTKDHIYPRSLGGASTLDNMQTMCELCNQRKGSTVAAASAKHAAVAEPPLAVEHFAQDRPLQDK